VLVVLRRTLRQNSYQPVLEDWLWHIIFPFLAYATFVVTAIILPGNPVPVLYFVGAASVLLLFIGIHNAWDTVTYITLEMVERENKGQD
jgi:hypothetical protein